MSKARRARRKRSDILLTVGSLAAAAVAGSLAAVLALFVLGLLIF